MQTLTRNNSKLSREVKTTVRRNIQRINCWRNLGVQWKPILKALGLPCNEKTLAQHYIHRGIL